jgi:hypothetical protein
MEVTEATCRRATHFYIRFRVLKPKYIYELVALCHIQHIHRYMAKRGRGRPQACLCVKAATQRQEKPPLNSGCIYAELCTLEPGAITCQILQTLSQNQ